MIRDEKDMENHLNYIHFNPVKHGLVTRPVDWEWSSFHRYVKDGVYEQDWGDQDILSLQLHYEE
jgi:putative transposase